jgi:hypothetical protein
MDINKHCHTDSLKEYSPSHTSMEDILFKQLEIRDSIIKELAKDRADLVRKMSWVEYEKFMEGR